MVSGSPESGGGIRTILTPAYRMPGVNIADPRIAEGVEVTLKALSAMHEHCRGEGAKLLVVILPTKEHTFSPFVKARDHNSQVIELSRHHDRLEGKVRKRIIEILAAKRIDYLEVLHSLQQAIAQDEGNPFFESRNGHFSALGHRVIAHSVASHYLLQDSDF